MNKLTEAEAEQRALELGRTCYAVTQAGDELVIDTQRTEHGAVGWVFWVESRLAVEADSYDASLLGVRGIFVHHDTGYTA